MNHRKRRSTQEKAARTNDRSQPQTSAAAPVQAVQASVHAPSSAATWYSEWAVCGLLLLAVAMIFGKTVAYGFVNYDDETLVRDNPMVVHGLSVQGIRWAFTANVGAVAYPMTWISYMLDSELFGPRPWGFHLTNVLLHMASTVILFLALRRMSGDWWAAALVSLLFAVHPLQVESVAWVAERKGVLGGFFFVSAIASYAAYVRHPFSAFRYLSVAGLYILALLAKPNLVMLPFLLLILDYWPLTRLAAGPRRSVLSRFMMLAAEKIPILLISVGGVVLAFRSQAGNIVTLQNMPLSARLANALISYAAYFVQFFLPMGLAAFYPRVKVYPLWQVGGAVILLAAISLVAIMLRRRQPAVLAGWLWYLGALLPMIGLVSIGDHARADRYMYLPLIGLSIAVVWGARWAIEQVCADLPSRRLSYVLGGALLLAGCMACAWRQTSYWQNGLQLWTHAMACTANNSKTQFHLGVALDESGRVDEAIARYRNAVDLSPEYADAYNNLGLDLAGRGQIDEAIQNYHKVIELNPAYAPAYNNLGMALAGRGKIDEAIANYRKALRIKADYTPAQNNLGMALVGLGKFDEAIAQLREALETQPDNAEAHNNLGMALAGGGKFDEAIAHFRKVLAMRPDSAVTENNLGLALAGIGQVDEAIAHLRKAVEMQPDYIEAHNNLGDVLAGHGRPAEALEQYQKALDLAASRNDRATADFIRAKISALQGGGKENR